MSNLTHRILSGIDYDNIAKLRRDNYQYLHSKLENSNELNIEYVYATNIVPIPIDQRNGINEMEFIGHLIQ